jgi:hypothetical protein
MTGPALAQANHHVAGRFARHNADLRDVPEGEEEFSIEGSGCRADTMTRALSELPSPCALRNSAAVLDIPTVLNKMTCQQMVFRPGSGEVTVWRRAEG